MKQKLMSLLKNRFFQIFMALMIGITVGAVFYPTKRVEERVEAETTLRLTEKFSLERKSFNSKISELQERMIAEEQATKTTESQLIAKIDELRVENSSLRQKTKERTFKLVKPDGTIVEKTYKESDTEATKNIMVEIRSEFDQKIKTIESKWKRVHTERVKKINEQFKEEITELKAKHSEEIKKIKTEKITTTNEKRFGVEGGATLRKEWYIHPTAGIWGPLFIGAQVSFDEFTPTTVGLGLGIKF